jgi:hypothetical protein
MERKYTYETLYHHDFDLGTFRLVHDNLDGTALFIKEGDTLESDTGDVCSTKRGCRVFKYPWSQMWGLM